VSLSLSASFSSWANVMLSGVKMAPMRLQGNGRGVPVGVPVCIGVASGGVGADLRWFLCRRLDKGATFPHGLDMRWFSNLRAKVSVIPRKTAGYAEFVFVCCHSMLSSSMSFSFGSFRSCDVPHHFPCFCVYDVPCHVPSVGWPRPPTPPVVRSQESRGYGWLVVGRRGCHPLLCWKTA